MGRLITQTKEKEEEEEGRALPDERTQGFTNYEVAAINRNRGMFFSSSVIFYSLAGCLSEEALNAEEAEEAE